MILKPKDRQAAGAEGFRSLDEYIRDLKANGFKVAWVKTVNLGATPPERAHLVMASTAVRNRRVKRPALHLIFSFALGERPIQPVCEAIVEQSLEWLGFGDHQAMIVADDERGHFHLHVMVNVVHPHTYLASKFREGYKYNLAVAVAAHIERKFGLERVPRPTWSDERILAELTGRNSTAKAEAGESKDSAEKSRTERASEAQLHREFEDVADAVKRRLDRKPSSFRTWAELNEYFVSKGIHYRAMGNGAVIGMNGHEARASKAGREWSLPSLKKHLGGDIPEPLRLGVAMPIRAKPAPVEKLPPAKDSPLIDLAAKLAVDAVMVHRVGQDGSKKRMEISAEDLPAKISGLLRAAAKGESITVAPIAADRHFLPVQEMTAEQLATLESDHTPAAVFQHGDTYDVFVAVQKQNAELDAESAAARQLTENLQEQYAPGVPVLSAIGVLPAPGFPCQPQRRQESESKIVKLLRPVATFCKVATATFKKLVREWGSKLKSAVQGPKSNSAMIALEKFDLAGPPLTEAGAVYRAHLVDMAERSPAKGLSQDGLNRLLAQRLRDGGSRQAEIAEILEAGLSHTNPELEDLADKANEVAKWICNPVALESHPPIAGMAATWRQTTETAKEQFLERSSGLDRGSR
jgi:hypothetical protein